MHGENLKIIGICFGRTAQILGRLIECKMYFKLQANVAELRCAHFFNGIHPVTFVNKHNTLIQSTEEV